ncbi:MAG: hypothetical protein KOO63_03640 [Bacteroidales bacterium]|nr:hypothetical protein [Candidatus Latescibacterota bacterium]
MRFVFVLACLFTATSALADVLIGEGGRPFDSEDWVLAGDLTLYPDRIGTGHEYTDAGSSGSATIAVEGICEGIVADIRFSVGWRSDQEIKIIDNYGQVCLYARIDTSNYLAYDLWAMGQYIGEIPYAIANHIRLTFSTPLSGEYQWKARIEDLGTGEYLEYAEPGTTPMPFLEPITFWLHGGYATSVYIFRANFIGDNVVSTTPTSWGTIKCLYR